METIGNKITETRRSKGINQKELASLIGVSQPSLIKFEKGETDIIPLGVAKKLAKNLGVSFNELFEIDFYSADWQTKTQENIDHLWASLKEKNEKLKELEKRIEEKDLLIDYLKKINAQLEFAVAEQFIFHSFYYLIEIEEKLFECTSEKGKSELIAERNLAIENLEDVDIYVNEKILSVDQLLFVLFNVDGFKRLAEKESTNQRDFINYCSCYINQFSKIEKTEIERYIEKNISTKWNQINIKKNKPEFGRVLKSAK